MTALTRLARMIGTRLVGRIAARARGRRAPGRRPATSPRGSRSCSSCLMAAGVLAARANSLSLFPDVVPAVAQLLVMAGVLLVPRWRTGTRRSARLEFSAGSVLRRGRWSFVVRRRC